MIVNGIVTSLNSIKQKKSLCKIEFYDGVLLKKLKNWKNGINNLKLFFEWNKNKQKTNKVRI